MVDIDDEESASTRFVSDVLAGALAVCGDSAARADRLTDLSLAAPRAARRRGSRLREGLPASPVLAIPAEVTPIGWESALATASDAGAVFVVPFGGCGCPVDPALLSALDAHRRLVVPCVVDDRRIGLEEAALMARFPGFVPLHLGPGDRGYTDGVLGVGAWAAMTFSMDALAEAGCLQGVVVPVTAANLDEVLEAERLRTYIDLGCRVVILVQASLAVAFPQFGGRMSPSCPSAAEAHVRRMLSLRIAGLRTALSPALVLDCSYLAPGCQMDGFPGRCMDGFSQAF